MLWPCETRTSTCRNFATISSGLYRFLAITVLLDVKDIPQVGPLQWGWISSDLDRTVIIPAVCVFGMIISGPLVSDPMVLEGVAIGAPFAPKVLGHLRRQSAACHQCERNGGDHQRHGHTHVMRFRAPADAVKAGLMFVILMFSVSEMKTSLCRFQSFRGICFVLAAP